MLRAIRGRVAASNPFELYLIALVILGGLPLLLGGPAPLSLEHLLDRFWQLLWGAELVLGGGTKLAGVLLGRTWLRVAGLRLLGWASIAYAVAITASLTPGSPAGLGYITGFAVACFAQVRYLRRAADVVDRETRRRARC